jgi:hypothetical protein
MRKFWNALVTALRTDNVGTSSLVGLLGDSTKDARIIAQESDQVQKTPRLVCQTPITRDLNKENCEVRKTVVIFNIVGATPLQASDIGERVKYLLEARGKDVAKKFFDITDSNVICLMTNHRMGPGNATKDTETSNWRVQVRAEIVWRYAN